MDTSFPKPITENLADWADEEKLPGLVAKFHAAIEQLVDRDLLVLSDSKVIYGINWYGVEMFCRLTGIIGGSKSCREGMEFVVMNICKPVCAAKECELLELFEGIRYKGKSVVGVMNTFHSYTWKEAVQDTLRSVRGGMIGNEDEIGNTYFWWDLFCQNQHHVTDVIGTFDRAVTQCSTLAMTIPDASKPIALQRVWCLFEVMSAVVKENENSKKKKEIKIMCNPAVEIIKNANTDVDVRNAQATVQSDKQMILDLIESRIEGGCDALNQRVKKVLMNGFYSARIIQNAAKSMDLKELDADIEAKKREQQQTKLDFSEIKERILNKVVGIRPYNLNDMNKSQLVQYAIEHDVDLSGEAKPKELTDFARRAQHQRRGKKMAFNRARDI